MRRLLNIQYMMKNYSNFHYCDSNFLISYFVRNHKSHEASKKRMADLRSKKVNLMISCLVFNETIFIIWGIMNNQVPRNKRRPIKDLYKEFKVILDFILNSPFIKIIQFENNLIQGVQNMLENIRNYDIVPSDACHYAMMQDVGVNTIVTKDIDDFGKIPGLKILTF